MRRSIVVTIVAFFLPTLSGCGPSEQQKAQWAEEKRVACLDKVCEGDVEPQRNNLTESVMKLNGQYFIAPRAYAKGFASLAFYWPSKTPLTGRSDGQPYPEERQDFSDVAIEIFLRRTEGIFQGLSRYERLLQAEREGRLVSKTTLRPGLDLWRTQENDGLGAGVWYVATKYVNTDGDGAVLSCRDVDPAYARCFGAFLWRPGIGADMRFRAKYALDWPEIYQEAQRILNLLKKA